MSEERAPATTMLRWVFIILLLVTILVMMLTAIAASTLFIFGMQGDRDSFLPVAGVFLGQFNKVFEQYFSQIFPAIWTFLAPLAQVAILLFVLEWFFRRMGFSFSATDGTEDRTLRLIFVALIAVLALLSVVNKELLGAIWDSVDDVVVVLLVVAAAAYLLRSIGIGTEVFRRVTDLNVQAVMAIIIITSLSLLALVNVNGANVVKDIALVVVGFYFGSRRTEGASAGAEPRTGTGPAG